MPVAQARANVAAFLDRTLQDPSQPGIARYMAAMTLKYYDHSDLPRPAGAVAMGVYDHTLADTVRRLTAKPVRAAPAPRCGGRRGLKKLDNPPISLYIHANL
jgi:hypothetical protein